MNTALSMLYIVIIKSKCTTKTREVHDCFKKKIITFQIKQSATWHCHLLRFHRRIIIVVTYLETDTFDTITVVGLPKINESFFPLDF